MCRLGDVYTAKRLPLLGLPLRSSGQGLIGPCAKGKDPAVAGSYFYYFYCSELAITQLLLGDMRVSLNDFADPGKLAAYVGLVPRVLNSNQTEHSGRITKQGNKLARTCLVQCAPVAKRYSPFLKDFYQRIQSTHPVPPRRRQGQHRSSASSWESSTTL
jgi:hypothetical protein